MINRSTGIRQSVDWWVVGVYLLLVVIGWVNIYAATHAAEAGSLLDFSTRAGKQFLIFPLLFEEGVHAVQGSCINIKIHIEKKILLLPRPTATPST